MLRFSVEGHEIKVQNTRGKKKSLLNFVVNTASRALLLVQTQKAYYQWLSNVAQYTKRKRA